MRKYQVLLILMFLSITFCSGQKVVKYFVVNGGRTGGDGSIEKPFSTIKEVQQSIRSVEKRKYNIQVIIREGIYELSEPLIFNIRDGGDSLYSIEYIGYPGESVIISGGTRLAGNWIKTESNIWKLKIKNFDAKKNIFRSLYLNDKRLQRATSDTLYSEGPIPQFASLYKTHDFNALKRLTKDSINVFCGFVYSDHSLNKLNDVSSAEVIAYNSWEASWHSVRILDKKKQIIYFKNPATYPVGFFGPRIRFRVENSLDYLDKPGEWQLDYKTGSLSYFAIKGENPNKLNFYVPLLDTLLLIKGDESKKEFVNNIKFKNINFRYSASTWGVNKIPNQDKYTNKQKFPWVDFSEGFSSVQASLDCGQAILLEYAKNCSFENCSFSQLGNYAIWIGQFSKQNTISNSTINDIGGGGIIIGINSTGGKKKNWPEGKSPSFNKIVNCKISNCGVIFPSGVGIGVMQASNNTIKGNTLFDLPYTGISIGWTYNFDDNYTSFNRIEGNYVHNVMKILADGAGIYTLGKQTGSIYSNNYIKNIYRSKSAIGSQNNGFFFDEGSSGFLVDSNVVENIQNKDIRYNKTDSTRIKFGSNYFDKITSDRTLLKLKQARPTQIK
jgi:hypothetical protein